MKAHCKKTCNMCPSLGICKDDKVICASWAAQGECSRNKKFMSTHCQVSCELCSQWSTAVCEDSNRYCTKWSRAGYCQSIPSYMKHYCAKSCRSCGGGGASVSLPPPGPVISSPPDFAVDALNRHNFYRRIHNAPAMTLDADLSKAATAWAEKMAKLGRLKSSTMSERDWKGENLGIRCDSTQGDGSRVVDCWYKSVCKYDFTEGSMSTFSQVVWKTSTRLGVGRAKGVWMNYQCTFWVGRYYHHGNEIGAYQQNVSKGSFDKKKFCKK
ncbi:Golgi-associated plant pathogenesis-related protein 1-like isoform X2 [Nematostella vectensis]|nr:Golgi-associated plant pathogenesis-related protein 1-like isoform X2 [Nematostella vectensis]